MFRRLLHSSRKSLSQFRHIFNEYQRVDTPNYSSVLFVGYAEAALGLGETFRTLLAALDDAGLQFSIYPFNANVETRRIGPFLPRRYDLTGTYDILVAYIAADQIPYFLRELKTQITSAKYKILRTYWELPRAPNSWASLLREFDELWVPNSFVREAFLPIFEGTITTIPVCVRVPLSNPLTRFDLAMDDTRFYFLFSFDYYSSVARKNPLGLALAFAYAFPDPNTNVGLIIKTTGPAELNPVAFQLLQDFGRIDKRVTIVNGYISRDKMIGLLYNCNAYVSLHRSEGFGVGMAEAMLLGKPVIGTEFSGNCDFLNDKTGFPVSYELRQLLPGEYPEGEGQTWAEPDLRSAIGLMRHVFSNPEEARARSARGTTALAAVNGPTAVTRLVENRLHTIRVRHVDGRTS